MESEIETAGTRKQIRKSDLPIDLPSLSTSLVRQKNDLRKTLRRFEKEKQKKMKVIDSDIWELQKFVQGLKNVTSFSADHILKRKPSERHLDASLDKSSVKEFAR